MSSSSRRHDFIALAILTLIATVLFFDVLVGTHNFYMRDLTRYYYPTKQVLREIVQNGEFPYWNRLFAAGQPIAANPEHEVFYPLTWLILLPSYDLGYRLHILVHIYIGLWGMYALLRSMELRAVAASFGAISFALGGIYMSYINLLPILFCAAWIPLTCLYTRKFMLEPKPRYFALASLFFGVQCLVGEPTTIVQTGFLLGMYALYRGWYAARDAELPWTAAIPEMLTRVAFVGLISFAAFLVGAAQMIPAIDHVGDSARSRPFEFSLVSAWSFPWAKFAEPIYPNVLGHISVDQVTYYWAGGLYPGMNSPFIFSIYCGLLAATLAVSAFFVRPRGGRFVLIVAAFSFAIALGSNAPVLKWLYELGVAEAIRYPEKFVFIAGFAAILLASQLMQRLLDGDDEVRQAALGFVAATTLVAGLLALLSLTRYYDETFRYVWGLSGNVGVRMTNLSKIGWVTAFARGLVLLGLLWLLPRLRRPLWVALTGLFVVSDVANIAHQINPRQPSRFFFEKPPILAQLREPRDAYRVFPEVDWYAREPVARQYFSTGAAVYWIVRNGLYPMTPAGHGVAMVMERDYDKTALLPTIAFVDSVWGIKAKGGADWWRPVMAMSNAWYRSVYRPYEQERKRVRGNMFVAQPVDYVESEHWPRYYFTPQIVHIKHRGEFIEKVASGRYSDQAAFITRPIFPIAEGRVLGYRETANTAAIDVSCTGPEPCFLVMSVTPHKYWRITVDGKQVVAYITNIGFQGIPVPPGRHRVEMVYRNTLVDRGLKISIASSVLLLGFAFVRPRRRRYAR